MTLDGRTPKSVRVALTWPLRKSFMMQNVTPRRES